MMTKTAASLLHPLHPDPSAFFETKKGKPVALPVPRYPLADTHTHLASLKEDAHDALIRAALAGVRMMIVPIDPIEDVPQKWGSVAGFVAWFDELRRGATECLQRIEMSYLEELYQQSPAAELLVESISALPEHIYIVAGAHPYGAKRWSNEARQIFFDLLDLPFCKGVGEVGLDVGPWNSDTITEQLPSFEWQVNVALERSLPLELHLRDGDENTAAHDAALEVIQRMGPFERGIDLHCYTSGPDVLKPYLELGCSAAFGGALTFARSKEIREAAALMPLKRVFIETDAPYMAPVPLRGLSCEPAAIALTAAALAELRSDKDCVDLVYKQLFENACMFIDSHMF